MKYIDKNDFTICETDSTGIELIRCHRVVIKDIHFKDFGVIMRRCSKVTIMNCSYSIFNRANIRVIDSREFVIEKNHFEIDKPNNDAVLAIQIQGESQEGIVSKNTIINYIDGIGLAETKDQINDYAGLIIEKNDIYIDDRVRFYEGQEQFARTENAIDIKNASLDPATPVVIRKNKLHGHRWSKDKASSGSSGAALIVHRYAMNIVIEDNEIYDVVEGIRIGPTVVSGKWFYPNNRNVKILKNKFHHIFKSNEIAKGAVYYIASETVVEGNIEDYYTKLLFNRHVLTEIR